MDFTTMNVGEIFLNSKNKLKKILSEEKKDSSAPCFTDGELSAQEVKEYQEEVLDVNIESWYHLIKDHTFKTKFMPFSPEVGQLFIDSYTHYESFLKQQTASGKTDSNESYVPSPVLVSRIQKLGSQLQSTMDSVKSVSNQTQTPPEPTFIKTSSRSAKDAPTSQNRLKTIYLANLAAAADKSDNTKIISLLQAGLETMKAHSAIDALNMFMCSERIYQDMLLALQRPDRWNENFVVRQWIDIDIDMEFRGFVKDGKLCALSQYNHLAYFPRVATHQTHISQRLREFFQDQIADKLHANDQFRDYVIDFAITTPTNTNTNKIDISCDPDLGFDLQSARVWVIELNPFLPTTDGCLFSWKTEQDILQGQHPFEMRVVTAPRNGEKALVSADWRAVLESHNE